MSNDTSQPLPGRAGEDGARSSDTPTVVGQSENSGEHNQADSTYASPSSGSGSGSGYSYPGYVSSGSAPVVNQVGGQRTVRSSWANPATAVAAVAAFSLGGLGGLAVGLAADGFGGPHRGGSMNRTVMERGNGMTGDQERDQGDSMRGHGRFDQGESTGQDSGRNGQNNQYGSGQRDRDQDGTGQQGAGNSDDSSEQRGRSSNSQGS